MKTEAKPTEIEPLTRKETYDKLEQIMLLLNQIEEGGSEDTRETIMILRSGRVYETVSEAQGQVDDSIE